MKYKKKRNIKTKGESIKRNEVKTRKLSGASPPPSDLVCLCQTVTLITICPISSVSITLQNPRLKATLRLSITPLPWPPSLFLSGSPGLSRIKGATTPALSWQESEEISSSVHDLVTMTKWILSSLSLPLLVP